MTRLTGLASTRGFALGLSVTAVSTAAALMTGYAAERAYTCEVMNAYRLTDSGVLDDSGFSERWSGSQFSVSRYSGEIIGDLVNTERAESTSVINFGSGANSFKSLALFPPIGGSSAQAQIIEVQEFISGPVKPFVVMSMGGAGIATGQCR